MKTGAGGTKMRRWVLAGLAAAVPLAAVALYFALVAPAPTPSAAGPAAVVTPTLPPNHPRVEGAATPEDRPHPPTGSTGRTVRVPDSVKGKWQAVKLKVEAKNGASAPQIVTVKLGRDLVIPGSALRLRADDFLPALLVKDGEITSASNEPSNPAALVTIRDGDKETFRGWLFGKFPDMQPFEHQIYRITLVEGIPKG
ncbi:MAG: DUF2155 domain-containing protein [candidate division NC10 bacterium]|nr:DUF2155 domain-containing protein [candidate division NC10 bacterium]